MKFHPSFGGSDPGAALAGLCQVRIRPKASYCCCRSVSATRSAARENDSLPWEPGHRHQELNSGLCHAGTLQHSPLVGGNSQDLHFHNSQLFFSCGSAGPVGLGTTDLPTPPPDEGDFQQSPGLWVTAISCLSNKPFSPHQILCQPIFSPWAPSSSASAWHRDAASNQHFQPVWDGCSTGSAQPPHPARCLLLALPVPEGWWPPLPVLLCFCLPEGPGNVPLSVRSGLFLLQAGVEVLEVLSKGRTGTSSTGEQELHPLVQAKEAS